MRHATQLTIILWLLVQTLANADQQPSFYAQVQENTCRVRVPLPGGADAWGTGILLHGKVPWVLTASHVVENSGRRVYCVFDGKSYLGTVEAVRRDEGAVIRLDFRPMRPKLREGLPISTIPVAPGETVYAGGWGGPSGAFRWASGRVGSNALDGTSREFPGFWRQGDSGGPVVAYRDGRVQVIGVAWGRSSDSVVFTSLEVTRALFNLETETHESFRSGTDARIVPVGSIRSGSQGTYPWSQRSGASACPT